MKKLLVASMIFASGVALADADLLERSAGFKIGERLTLRPYLNLSCSFESNPDCRKDASGESDVYWSINPGANIDFAGEQWKVNGSVYYRYNAFSGDRRSQHSNSCYGEQLGVSWFSMADDGSSWSLLLSEQYQVANQSDSFASTDGRGLWRDRKQFTFSGAFQRRFNERLHASINGSFYWMDYDNDPAQFMALYGWDRWTAGGQIGYTLSKWTDFFISGNYQHYNQTNVAKSDHGSLSGQSQGWTLHAGLGSYLTDRITYRVSGGVSSFEYGGEHTSTTFTYQGSLNWKIGETWSTSLLFSSYYQPSEREYAAAIRCDNVSWGLTKSLVRGKLSATFDAAYRRETNTYSSPTVADWDLNLITARLGLNYSINRFIAIFARGEFQTEINDGDASSKHYDYERWRATLGLRLAY